MQGHTSLKKHQHLKGLDIPGNAQIVYQEDHSLFHHYLDEAVRYQQLQIIGNRYRSRRQQEILRYKKKNALVLLVPEPRNPYDPNAIAAFVSGKEYRDDSACSDFSWFHVGYLSKDTAARLVHVWPISKSGLPYILQASLDSNPTANNIMLRVRNPEYDDHIRARVL